MGRAMMNILIFQWYLDDERFDEDVDEHADPLDANPVGDGEGDDEGGVGEDCQHMA